MLDVNLVNPRINPKSDLTERALVNAGVQRVVGVDGVDGNRPHHGEGGRPPRALGRGDIVDGAALAQRYDVVNRQILQPMESAQAAVARARPELAVVALGRVHDECATIGNRIAGRRVREPSDRKVLVEVGQVVELAPTAQPPEEAAEDASALRPTERAREALRERIDLRTARPPP